NGNQTLRAWRMDLLCAAGLIDCSSIHLPHVKKFAIRVNFLPDHQLLSSGPKTVPANAAAMRWGRHTWRCLLLDAPQEINRLTRLQGPRAPAPAPDGGDHRKRRR